jgi:hypothetical protein
VAVQTPHHAQTDSNARHRAAVGTTLSWADDAAARGDYAEALAWIETLDAIGDELTGEYQTKRGAWLAMTDAGSGSPRERMPA